MNSRRTLICWGALVILVALLGASSVMASGGAAPLLQSESQLISLINDYRTSQGLMPLSQSSILMQVAEAHSQDMRDRDFFDHTNPDGLDPGERLTNAGYNWSVWGELIGCGYSTPQAMLNAWKGSPVHDSIMLSTSFTEIGVGYVSGGSCGHYWTAVFAEPLAGGYAIYLYLPIVLKAY